MTACVRFEKIAKSFGGTAALSDVSFEVARGTVHALVGENGAGKSTLMRILAGAIQPDKGRMTLDGRDFEPANPREALERGVAVVYQELSLVPHLSAAENVYLGRWPQGAFGWVKAGALHRQAGELFARLGLNIPLKAQASTLGVAQQQMVEIARALS